MKPTSKTLIPYTLLSILACSSNLLLAQPAGGRDGPPKPPKEALDACKSLSAGQACSFNSQQGTVNGICWAPERMPLACKPKDAPDGESRPPKQSSGESYDEQQAVREKVALHRSFIGLAGCDG